MSDDTKKGVIVDVTGLSAPLTKLVETISAGIGVLYEPRRTRKLADAASYERLRLAEADREIADLAANAEVARNELVQRTLRRIAAQEVRHQGNIEAIAEVAADELEARAATVAPEPVDPDWTSHFFSSAQTVSDAQLRVLWARVLAGEVEIPGSVSRRALSILRDFSRQHATAFARLAQLVWTVGGRAEAHAPEASDDEEFARLGVGADDIREFESLGLVVARGTLNIVYRISPDEPMVMHYHGRTYEVRTPPHRKAARFTSQLQLTMAGGELARIAAPRGDPDYLSMMIGYLREHHEVTDLAQGEMFGQERRPKYER